MQAFMPIGAPKAHEVVRGPRAKRRVRSNLSVQLWWDCHAPVGRSQRRTSEITTPPKMPPKCLTASQVWSMDRNEPFLLIPFSQIKEIQHAN